MTASLWSQQTTATWDQGVLAGTGSVGAVLYGDPQRHVVVVSHERFFVPANSRRPAPLLSAAVSSFRDALKAGDSATAADRVDQALIAQDWPTDELIWTDPLAPIAQIEWCPSPVAYDDYRRHISLSNGNCSATWSGREGKTSIRLHTVQGSDSITVELWADHPLTGTLTLSPVEEVSANASTVVPVDYSDRVGSETTVADDVLGVKVLAAGVEPGTDASATVTLSSAVARPRDSAGRWEIHLVAGVSQMFDVDIRVEGFPCVNPAPQVPTTAILQRSQLDVAPAPPDEPTEELWARARAGDPLAEAQVLQTAFAAGRRNVAVSTGCLPPTLQGVWQGTWSPAWSADYTLNGNVQLGAMAAMLWTGMPELMPSLFRLIRRYEADYRENARNIFGFKGMMLPARMSTHGHANHFLRAYPHQFWIGSGPWFLRMATDYVQVTGDRSIIDEWLWDYANEILEFSEEVLVHGDGHIIPSYSPENTPAGSENPLATDAATDIAVLRDAFAIGTWLAHGRGEEALAQHWNNLRNQVPPYQVAADGTLAEWEPQWNENIAHRHASQLQGLWYDPDELLLEPSLRAAAQKTVAQKIAWRAEQPYGPPGRMEMAFGLSSIGLAAASLGDAAAAYQCAVWLARDHFTPALTTTHDEGEIFNVDAAGALPAVVAAMLVQSSPGHLRLLPALPPQWRTGSATGLGARGGVTVERITWSPNAIDVKLVFLPHSAWLHPEGTLVHVPVPSTLTSESASIETVGPQDFRIPPDTSHARLHLQLDPPQTDDATV